MTSKLNTRSLRDLEQLSRLREILAQEKLARCALAVRAIDNQITGLTSRTFQATTPEDAYVIEKWQMWRTQELRRLLTQKASLMAAKHEAAIQSGRKTAEREVVEKLRTRSVQLESKLRERRAGYIS